MDIQEQIDQFLQIPEIKEIFSDHGIHWHAGEYSQGWYFDFSVPDYEKGFFLGVWLAWQAKAQANQKLNLLLCDEHLKKCESPTGVFNSQYPDEEPCLICLHKARAAPEGYVVVHKEPLLKMIESASMLYPVKNIVEAQEPTND